MAEIETREILGGRYTIDSLGRVYDCIHGNYMLPKDRYGNGILGVTLRVGKTPDEPKFKWSKIQSLVGQAFLGTTHVRHKDRDRNNNRVENLEVFEFRERPAPKPKTKKKSKAELPKAEPTTEPIVEEQKPAPEPVKRSGLAAMVAKRREKRA